MVLGLSRGNLHRSSMEQLQRCIRGVNRAWNAIGQSRGTIGMRVREHDRGRRHGAEPIEPVRAAIDHDNAPSCSMSNELWRQWRRERISISPRVPRNVSSKAFVFARTLFTMGIGNLPTG